MFLIFGGRFHQCKLCSGAFVASDSASTSCEWDAPGLTDVALPRAIVGVVRGGNTTGASGRLAVTDWLDCVGGGGGHWVGAENNFDNVLFAMQALFECSTFEGWLEPLNMALDARQVGDQLQK